MSSLNFNKVAGSVLATALAIVGLRELSAGVFTQEPVAKPGYAVEVAADAGSGPAAAEVPPDWGTVLPTADVAAGEATFAKCKSCHNADNGGPNQTGPNLWGAVGRKPGSHPGFAYSGGMTDFGSKQPVWDYQHLYEFIANPQKYIPGTKMTFVGLKKPEERIAVIAYLHKQGSSLPIPAPNPAAAAAAPAPTGPDTSAKPAAGSAGAGQPVATGSTATPAAGAGGPTGQGPGAPAQETPQVKGSPTAAGNTRPARAQ